VSIWISLPNNEPGIGDARPQYEAETPLKPITMKRSNTVQFTTAGIANTMLAVCVGLCGCQFQNSFFLFRAGAIIQSFFSAVENFFQKDLVCIVIVFTFALQN